MNMTRVLVGDEDTFSSVIDVSTLSDGDNIEGLALVERVENGKTKSERFVSRFFLRGKFNLVTQANFYLMSRDYFKCEDAAKLNKKIVYIKGLVEVYDYNHIIINLEKIQEFKSDLTVSDFYMENEEIEKYSGILANLIEEVNQNYRPQSECQLDSKAVLITLSRYCSNTEDAYVGDELVITTKLVQDFITPRIKSWQAAFLTVVFQTAKVRLKLKEQELKAADTSLLSPKADELFNIYNSICAGGLLQTKAEYDEIKHLLDVLYLGSKPLTHFSKVFKNGSEYYQNYLVSQHLESMPNIIDQNKHIRLR